MSRIEWSYDGTKFVSVLPDYRFRLHALDGSVIRALGRAHDARWSDDGTIMSLDDRAEVRFHGAIGVERQFRVAAVPYRAECAALAPRANDIAHASRAPRGIGVTPLGDGARWELPMKDHPWIVEPLGLALSSGGERLAIALRDGFAIFDVKSSALLVRATDLGVPATAFGFDGTGLRCVVGCGGAARQPGVMQLDVAGERPRDREPATAAAIDHRGAIAVYGRSEMLTFEFLAPDRDAAMVAVESVLEYAVPLPDIVALAFDPTSHWLACLDRSGSIEVVPVP